MNLVTVTCKADINDMLRQAKSIDKFCTGIIHYVVLNDDVIDVQMWERLLESHYKREKKNFLVVVDFEDCWLDYLNEENKVSFINKPNKRYLVQHFYKLFISKILNDYLILDSKNFFIKAPDYDYWAKLNCNDHIVKLTDMEPRHQKVIAEYCDYFGTNVPEYTYDNITPFGVKKEVMDAWTTFDEDLRWFINNDIYEFLFYSMYSLDVIKLNEKQPYIKSVLYGHTCPEVTEFERDDHVDILGIHRGFISSMDDETRENLNNYLIKLGIQQEQY